MKSPFALSLFFAAACSVSAIAQSAASNWEIGAGYKFVHSNAPPSGCGCFSMNGGSTSVNRQFTSSFSLAGEFDGTTNSSVNASGHSLTLLTYLAGPRYRVVPSRGRISLFGQVLAGGAHASGAMYAVSGSSSGSANAFATSIGGGTDVALSPRMAWRLIQAEYLLTLLPNGVNGRQNNIRIGTGVVLRFGGR